MLIIADTSALVALAACGALSLLDSLFADVRVPRAVWHECTVRGKPHAKRLEDYLVTKVSDIDLAAFVIAAPGLGRGARMNSIAVVGSLGVLVGAKAQGHVPAVQPYLAQIEAAGIYVSRELAAETLRLAGEE